VSQPPNFVPPIDETKVHPEVALHIRLLYDRIINHGIAFQNQQNQIKELQAQVAALKGKP